MWQWKPAKLQRVATSTTRSAASRARRRWRRAKPNFESSAPVSMYSCVCASTPGVTRTSTRGAGSPSATSASRRSSSSKESTTMRPTPALERGAQLGRPTCCCRGTRCASGGKPACSATCSSPPVATSRSQALLGDEPRHRRAEERLARVRHRAGAERVARTRGTGRAARPRRRRRAACRTRRRAPSRSTPPTGRRPSASTGADARQQRQVERRASLDVGVVVGLVVVVEARHLVGRAHAEQAERARRGRSGTPRPARAAPA